MIIPVPLFNTLAYSVQVMQDKLYHKYAQLGMYSTYYSYLQIINVYSWIYDFEGNRYIFPIVRKIYESSIDDKGD